MLIPPYVGRGGSASDPLRLTAYVVANTEYPNSRSTYDRLPREDNRHPKREGNVIVFVDTHDRVTNDNQIVQQRLGPLQHKDLRQSGLEKYVQKYTAILRHMRHACVKTVMLSWNCTPEMSTGISICENI